MDIVIDKPPQIRGYALHRIVAQHQGGKPALWADEGRQLRIRPREADPPSYEVGKLLAFTTKACVAFSSRNHHRYLPLSDWRTRRQWFETKAARHGFEVLGLHVTPGMQEVQTHDGRRFTVDATEFTGLLRVLDTALFSACLQKGIGKVGKAFGLNMLVVE